MHRPRFLQPANARRATARRAFSLIELLCVVMIVGVIASAAYLRFGETTYNTTSIDGFVRTLVLDLRQARRRTISTGNNHYLLFSRTGGEVASYTLYEDTGAGAAVVDRVVQVPAGATINTATDQWQFAFDGSVSGGTGSGTIVVSGPHHTWTVTIYLATGAIKSLKVAT